MHACIQQPKQRNCPSSLWNHTSINNAQFLECHVSLSIMLSKKDIRCLKADIDVGTTKCVGLLVKATDVSR